MNTDPDRHCILETAKKSRGVHGGLVHPHQGFRIRRQLLVVAFLGLDMGLMIQGPPLLAYGALVFTVALGVLSALKALIGWGNRGKGKTIF